MPERLVRSVTDPRRRDRVLVDHETLTRAEAAELAAIYRAIGYSDQHIQVVSDQEGRSDRP